ncbi:MAG: YHS domain-containing protein [Parcubacteria group bacterium GW2011_GWF1_40_5]|nr:MAG: YHS domain-containing protein [Parcubacteria group bacterium GW2011_GWF1_40_5]
MDNRDPVCGLQINPDLTKHRSTYDEKIYYFCSLECKNRFDDEPSKYAENNERED